jgi:short-subunit dehydrogenase
MKIELKPIECQVVVVAGLGSVIGLLTAQLASRAGAGVVLAGRDEAALGAIADELRAEGKKARAVVADPARAEDAEFVAEIAFKEFGGIDTWVNDAAVIVGAAGAPAADPRRLFELLYFGTVHGCLAAVPKLRLRGAGALINVATVVANRPFPLLAHCSAARHAIRGFTNALRAELQAAGAPVAVTLVKPESLDAAFAGHGRSSGVLAAPCCDAEAVARVVLGCAARARREVSVAARAALLPATLADSPGLAH